MAEENGCCVCACVWEGWLCCFVAFCVSCDGSCVLVGAVVLLEGSLASVTPARTVVLSVVMAKMCSCEMWCRGKVTCRSYRPSLVLLLQGSACCVVLCYRGSVLGEASEESVVTLLQEGHVSYGG